MEGAQAQRVAQGATRVGFAEPASRARYHRNTEGMADVVDQATRSRMMAGIRGRDTKPEWALRRGLHASGFRYRLHVRGLPGRPDLVFPRWNAVCLVHGCFWHRHPGCRYAANPATRPDFWQAKFAANVLRDQRNRRALLDEGWRVAVVWECALRGSRTPETVEALARWLRSESSEFETALLTASGVGRSPG